MTDNPHDNPIQYEDEPAKLLFVPVPEHGMTLLFKDGHEEYIRSCPTCGHRMDVGVATGQMPTWYCPVADAGGKCTQAREFVAKMSKTLAEDIAQVPPAEKCHKCGYPALRVHVHRRLNRVEVTTRHPEGYVSPEGETCKAETVLIFHTFSEQYSRQEWDEPKPSAFDMIKGTADVKLEEVSEEDAEKMLKESNS